jgi:aryl carrier-like protein
VAQNEVGGIEVAPATQEELRALLAGLLGTHPADITENDNLIELGIDSVAIMALVGRWQRAGLELTYADLAEQPTLAAWWHVLAAALPTSRPTSRSVITAERPEADLAEPFPPTPDQHP